MQQGGQTTIFYPQHTQAGAALYTAGGKKRLPPCALSTTTALGNSHTAKNGRHPLFTKNHAVQGKAPSFPAATQAVFPNTHPLLWKKSAPKHPFSTQQKTAEKSFHIFHKLFNISHPTFHTLHCPSPLSTSSHIFPTQKFQFSTTPRGSLSNASPHLPTIQPPLLLLLFYNLL